MSDASVALVREIYARWAEGRSAAALIANDVEYVNPPDAVEPGVRIGRSAFGAIRDAYDDLRVEPLEVIDAGGDEVLVIARITAKGRGSGVEVDWRQGYVWTIRDGVAVRFRWFSDPSEARAVVGLRD
jgi:ketosteroid isomerase-like protein